MSKKQKQKRRFKKITKLAQKYVKAVKKNHKIDEDNQQEIIDAVSVVLGKK